MPNLQYQTNATYACKILYLSNKPAKIIRWRISSYQET